MDPPSDPAVFRVLREQLTDDEIARQRLAARLEYVRATIAQADAALQIARVEERALVMQLDQKDRQLTQQRRTLCPISLLPDEMLGAIFRFAQQLESDDNEDSTTGAVYEHADYVLDSLETTSAVSLVCKSWRAAALDTPRLWGFLQFDLEKLSASGIHGSFDYDTCKENSAEMQRGMELYLARARSTPVEVVIKNYSLNAGEFCTRLLSAILACASRWRALSLLLRDMGTGADCPLFQFQIPTPLLEELYVDTFHISRKCCPAGVQMEILPHAPALRVLWIEACLAKRISGMACPSLSFLRLDGPFCRDVPFDSFAALLRRVAGTLEELEIFAESDAGDNVVAPAAAPDIHLPRLRRLICRDFRGMTMLAPLSGRLFMPALRILRVECNHERADNMAFVQACSSLRVLHVDLIGSSNTPGVLLRLLRALPLLEELIVEQCTFAVDDFRQLSGPAAGTDAWVVPNLRSFRARQCRFQTACTPADFLDFVRARVAKRAPAGCTKLADVEIAGYGLPTWLMDKATSIIESGRGNDPLTV